jgi:glycosyltransferase involved in cell wall biosynthesis
VKLLSVVVSYNRLELLKETVFSYKETVTSPHRLIVVDNDSDAVTRRWLRNSGLEVLFLDQNYFPGYATNRGWEQGIEDDTEFLHRSDNDFRFLPGWEEEVMRCFEHEVGQVGLRTDSEEGNTGHNCGGNCVIRRDLWDNGLRYKEKPWGQYPPGYSEDSYMSPAVTRMGWRWTRVKQPCIENLASGDWSEDYYLQSYSVRGITPHPDDPTAQHLLK